MAQEHIFKLKTILEFSGNEDAYLSHIEQRAKKAMGLAQTASHANPASPTAAASASLARSEAQVTGQLQHQLNTGQITQDIYKAAMALVDRQIEQARLDIQAAIRAETGNNRLQVKRRPAEVQAGATQVVAGLQAEDRQRQEAAQREAAVAEARRRTQENKDRIRREEARIRGLERTPAYREAAARTAISGMADGDRTGERRARGVEGAARHLSNLESATQESAELAGTYRELVRYIAQAHESASALATALEQAAREEQRRDDLNAGPESELVQATQRLTLARRQRELAELRLAHEATASLVNEEGEVGADARRRRTAIEQSILSNLTEQDAIEEGITAAKRAAHDAAKREATANARLVAPEVAARGAEQRFDDRVRTSLARGQAADPDYARRVADRNLAEEDRDLTEDKETALARLLDERLQKERDVVRALEQFADVMDRAGRQEQFNALLQSQHQLRDATERLAIARLTQAAEEAKISGSPAALKAATDADTARKELEARRLADRTATPENVEAGAAAAAERQKNKAALDAETQELLRSEEALKLDTKARMARRETDLAQRRAESSALRAQGGGTPTQRFQAWISERQGIRRPAEQFQTGRQFIASRAMTTGGFALSGALLYGGVQVMRDVFRESTELQQELAIIQGQFKQIDASASGMSFGEFKADIREIATDTGITADNVARTAKVLLGVFRTPEGDPDPVRASAETEVVMKASKISGLDPAVAQNDLVAISVAFADANGEAKDFTEILDHATYLEQKLGAKTGELIDMTGNLAPIAKDFGLTAEQLMSLSAAVGQIAGVSGPELSEKMSRILPQLKDNQDVIYQILGANSATASLIPELSKALSTNQLDDVLKLLAKAKPDLGKEEFSRLTTGLVGSREAGALSAILSRPDELTEALNAKVGQGEGMFEERWENFADTIKLTFQEVRREVERLGAVLMESGLDDFMVETAKVLGTVVSLMTSLLGVVGEVNDMFGGLPAKALAFAAALKAVSLANGVVSGGSGLLGGLFGSMGFGMADRSLFRSGAPTRRAQQLMASPAAGGGWAGWSALSWRQKVNPTNMWAAATPMQYGPYAGGMGFMPKPGARSAFTGMGLGLTRSLGPIAGMYAASALYDQYKAFQEEAEKKKQEFTDEAVEAYSKGLSDVQIAEQIGTKKGNEERDLSEFDRFKRGFMDFAFGKESPEDQAEEAAWEAITRQKAIDGTIQDVIDELDARADPDAVSDAVYEALSKTDIVGTGLTPGGFSEKDGRAKSGVDILQVVLDKYKKDPENEDLLNYLDNLLIYLGGDPELLDIVTEVEELARERNQADSSLGEELEYAQSGQAAYKTRVDLAQKRIEGGTGSYAALIAEHRSEQKILRDRLKGAIGAEAKAVAESLLLDAIAAEREADLAMFKGQLDILDHVAGEAGGPQARLEASLRQFRAMATSRFTTQDRYDKAVEISEARDAAFDQAMSDAESDAEKLYLLRKQDTGPRPEDRAEIAQQISVSGAPEALAALMKFRNSDDANTVKTHDEMVDALTDIAYKNGEFDKKAVEEELRHGLAMREARLDTLQARLIFTKGLGNPDDVEGIQKQIEQVNAAIEGNQKALSGLNSFYDPSERRAQDRKRQEEEIARRDLKARQEAQVELRRSLVPSWDPVAVSNFEVGAASDALATARRGKVVRDGFLLKVVRDQAAIDKALAAFNTAIQSQAEAVRSRAEALDQATFEVEKAMADGDPMKLARLEVKSANIQMSYARLPEEIKAAEAAQIAARNSERDAANEIENARADYLAALAGNDQLGAAKIGLSNADRAVSQAKGEAARYQAMAAQVEAKRSLDEAMMVLFEAQMDLASALLESNGDTVGVARNAVRVADERLRRARQAGAGQIELETLKAALTRSQTALTTEARSDRLGDLDYLYEFDRITASRYIELLRAELRKIPESNKNARREIERKIKALREEMSSDLQFNLPGELKLPTLYEVRRADQAGQMGGSYQDNRIVTVNVNQANDPAAVVNAVTDALGRPPVSTGTGLY